jgi:hypothetical protein
MAKKSFFRERTVAEIRKLKGSQAFRQNGLVRRIDGLSLGDEFLEIRARIVPGSFFTSGRTPDEASRKCLKENYLGLSHPETKTECFTSPLIPLQIREKDFAFWNQEEGRKLKEEEINSVGYFVRPNWGDRMKRVTPFAFLAEGLRLFAYAENLAGGIEVEPYASARRAIHEGADIVVHIPSRTKKHQHYKYKLSHVPVIRSPDNLATVLSLRPSVLLDEETGEPIEGRTPHEVYFARYTKEHDPESSSMITTYPHDVAAYLGIVKDQLIVHNMTPMEMNPHALFSQHGVDFYKKLCNNVLIYDGSLKSKEKLRKPHLAEKSILLARAIGVFGHDDFAFWDPQRDGKLKDYNWQVE